VIVVDLRVTPDEVVGRGRREVCQVDRPLRVRDIDERGADLEAGDDVLTAGLRIRPTPEVAPPAVPGRQSTTDLVDGEERQQIDALTRERAALEDLVSVDLCDVGRALYTWGVATRTVRLRRYVDLRTSRMGPRVVRRVRYAERSAPGDGRSCATDAAAPVRVLATSARITSIDLFRMLPLLVRLEPRELSGSSVRRTRRTDATGSLPARGQRGRARHATADPKGTSCAQPAAQMASSTRPWGDLNTAPFESPPPFRPPPRPVVQSARGASPGGLLRALGAAALSPSAAGGVASTRGPRHGRPAGPSPSRSSWPSSPAVARAVRAAVEGRLCPLPVRPPRDAVASMMKPRVPVKRSRRSLRP
jgi:hypothetical protein